MAVQRNPAFKQWLADTIFSATYTPRRQRRSRVMNEPRAILLVFHRIEPWRP